MDHGLAGAASGGVQRNKSWFGRLAEGDRRHFPLESAGVFGSYRYRFGVIQKVSLKSGAVTCEEFLSGNL
jgi:hypothetical protein